MEADHESPTASPDQEEKTVETKLVDRDDASGRWADDGGRNLD